MALTAKRPSKGAETRDRILKDVSETGEKKQRLNTNVEEALYRKIKMRAAEEGRTLSDITRSLWFEYLSK